MDRPDKNKPLPPEDIDDPANWSRDIENRDYYYDDSTGYEKYDPDDETDEETADDKEASESSPGQP